MDKIICKIEDCGNKVKSSGLCHKHYNSRNTSIKFYEQSERKRKKQVYVDQMKDPVRAEKVRANKRRQGQKKRSTTEGRTLDNMKRALRDLASSSGICKNESIPYTGKELWEHLINHKNWDSSRMSKDNYGRFGWHIDHIKPVSAFKLKDYASADDMYRSCFALENLQPMWHIDNIAKSDKWM